MSKDSRKGIDDHKAHLLGALDLLKSKRHFFILTVLLTVTGTLMGHYLKVPTFKTTSSLFVQNTNEPGAADYLLNQSAFRLSRYDRIESYVNHLKSDTFYLSVAEKLKFHKEFEQLNLGSPRQKSKLSLEFWKKRLASDDGSADEPKNTLLTPIENIVGFLKKSVTYESDFTSQFIQVHVKTLDARTSQLVANVLAQEFVTLTNSHSSDELKEIEDFVVKKTLETEDIVKALDKNLIQFKQKNNIVSADETTKSLAERLTNLESEIETAKLKKEGNLKLIRLFRKGRKEDLNQTITSGSSSTGSRDIAAQTLIQNRIDQLKRQKSAFVAEGYSATSFQIKELDTEIDKSVAQLKSILTGGFDYSNRMSASDAENKIQELSDENRVLTTKISTFRRARESLQSQIDLMPAIQQEFIRLQNQFKLEVENLAALERKSKELEIQRISQKKEVRMDQLAPLPGPTARGSLVLKLLFSGFASIFFGLLIVIGIETLDPSIKRRQDLFDCGVEFFGEIPVGVPTGSQNKSKMDFGSPEDLVCLNKPDSIESMSFKYMRARIESMRYKQKKNCQVICVSSALNDEGKSYISANLAISLSQLKRKTILIDADLRRPSQTAFFGLSAQSGLVDLLEMKKDLDDVLARDRTPNLDILATGSSNHNATELVGGQKFRLLLDHLRTEYEYIVIDTPPTFAVVDPAIVASLSDIPILVASYRETRKVDYNMAYNDLLQVSYKKVFGIINKAIVSNSRIHYYGYPLQNGDDTYNANITMSSGSSEEAAEFLKKLGKSG